MKTHRIIGMMSGTSLDGTDIACCEFREEQGKYHFDVLHAETIAYDHSWKTKLQELPHVSAINLIYEHREYGRYLGFLAKQMALKYQFQPQLLASHGHTIFHQPENNITFQLGDGNALAIAAGFPVIADFRTRDILFGGQGAPLVPVGDQLLFHEYSMCINIGGFSNCSYEKGNRRIAFDICPANMALNYFAEKAGQEFDKDGKIAKKGRVHEQLLNDLNDLEFYQKQPPKSLGREWFETHYLKVFDQYDISTHDQLRTATEHCAMQIARAIEQVESGKILISGGGAKSKFLVERIRTLSQNKIIIPDETIIDYKEALVFAFLGLLRWENKINCYASVTGASRNSSCGNIFCP